MLKKRHFFSLLIFLVISSSAQNLPGDKLSYGPMFSPVYNNSVRVWVMTQYNTGAGQSLKIEVTPQGSDIPLSGSIYDSDDRLGYGLRSFLYTNLQSGQTYNAVVKANGNVIQTSTIKNEKEIIDDFEFLAGGCARIFDSTRCIDQYEITTHFNGTPYIFDHMATEESDLMVWTGDAVYLLGLEHTNGWCPGAIDDWANKDRTFARYFYYRQFHDKLLKAMPQLAIVDNHDVGSNEFNKNLPGLPSAKEVFMEWWQNPEYLSTSENQGTHSAYKYKDVEFFLTDNRSYRDNTRQQYGVEQFEWLKNSLKSSTAKYKVLVSATHAFVNNCGGRNFCADNLGKQLLPFIEDNDIDGVIAISADVHRQELYGRYNDTDYPLFDVISGNLVSDVGSGNTSYTPDNNSIFNGVIQTYLRVNVYGDADDRRMKIDYVSPEGVVYYSAIFHEDMLKSKEEDAERLRIPFSNSIVDASKYAHQVNGSNVLFITDRNGDQNTAVQFGGQSDIAVVMENSMSMHDKSFTMSYWVNPDQNTGVDYSAILSNKDKDNGFTVGLTDGDQFPIFINHKTGEEFISPIRAVPGNWSNIVWKYDNVKIQLSLYFNGFLVKKWSGVESMTASSSDLRIGNDTEGNAYSGKLDDITIYGNLVSDAEIASMVNFTSHRGSALKLLGSQQTKINAGDVNPVLSQAFTMDFWAKLNTDPGTNEKIISSNGRVNGNSTGISLEFDDQNRLKVVLGNNGGGWTVLENVGPSWDVGNWYHITLRVIPGDRMRLYINGEEVGSLNYNQYVANNFGLGFGHSPFYGGTIQADIEEFRLWGSDKSIQYITANRHWELIGNEPDLQFYYDFNEEVNGNVVSKGAKKTNIQLNGSSLTSSLAPVGDIDVKYRDQVAASWNLKSIWDANFSLSELIVSPFSNIIIGRDNNNTIVQLATDTSIRKIAGGWQVDPLNLGVSKIEIDVKNIFTDFSSINAVASQFFLFKENNGQAIILDYGFYNGKTLEFTNTFLDTAVYFLGWKQDVGGPKFRRGKALSLLGNHNVIVPNAEVAPVLEGDFTIEFWAKFSEPIPQSGKMLSSHGRVNNNTKGLSLEFPSTSLSAVFGTNSGSWKSISSAQRWNTGEWNHVAITANNVTFNLYLNGEKIGSETYNGYVRGDWDLALGESLNYGGEVEVMFDEFRIWSEMRTAEEIKNTMHLSVGSQSELVYNYSFDHEDNGLAINSGSSTYNMNLSNATLVHSTAPVGKIDDAQRHHVRGAWSLKNRSNTGLSIIASISEYESNVVVGKDDEVGDEVLTENSLVKTLRSVWQIDPMNVEEGIFEFDGTTVFGSEWDFVKSDAIEFYLMKKNDNDELQVQAVGQDENNIIVFDGINLDYGKYTLGWKSTITGGFITFDHRSITFYPNPSNDLITINGVDLSTIDHVDILTLQGKTISSTLAGQLENGVVDVSSLSAGQYILRLFSNGNIHSVTFVRQ